MMQELATVWLICVLAGTSCAVFYTKSTDNDYPRIGRRSFFTGGGTSSFYPRVGRSRLLIATSGNTNDDITSGGQAYDGDFLSLINKRGIFTSGDQGFPRVGRAGSDASGSAIGNAVGEKSPASLAASAEAPIYKCRTTKTSLGRLWDSCFSTSTKMETKSFHGKSSLLEWEERGRKEQLADSLSLADSPSR
ncbi:hypothetical protein C0Q70_04282 [Pomacea canaliculata]|uniref:Uncharacterized protein n=2 Tax=Pomacea canaliculata TaxID=400727 RepID=A0A2T7PV34_POMCA|nr:uncharacterized protein LOC112557927 isoform X2 [Pomacea canaliculata]PVD37285.1 hypothetical protein C0Q70_04282 [Pomacea canaliculata]